MQNIDHILKLIQKTGDRAIVIDGDNSYVVMTVPEYERLAVPVAGRKNMAAVKETNGEPLIDKVNRDVALWRETQKEEKAAAENLEAAPSIVTPLEVAPPEEPQYLEPVIERVPPSAAAPAWSGLSALKDILMETQAEEEVTPEKEEKKAETQFFFEPVE